MDVCVDSMRFKDIVERNFADMTQTIDAAAFQQMVIHAAASINAEKQQINDLNVFPVPDGDTGTNMSLTIGAAATELKKNQYATVGLAAKAAASALLRAPAATRASSCPCCSAALPRASRSARPSTAGTWPLRWTSAWPPPTRPL